MVDTLPIKLPDHAADTSSHVSRFARYRYGAWTSHIPDDPSHSRRTPDAAGVAPVNDHPCGHCPTGQVILLLADQVPISRIAATVGISRRYIYKWVQRFLQEGLAGLADKRVRSHPLELHDRLDQHHIDVWE